MDQKRNYQRELDKKLEWLKETGNVPTLLLHSCCAPCSSYVLEYLSRYFRITVFYYNPNITDSAEYGKRVKEIRRLIREMKTEYPVSFTEGTYEPERFLRMAEGYEQVPEGGARCERCFHLRLGETARLCKEGGYDAFTTTLTISPLKNAALLNAIGEEEAAAQGVVFLNSDFKKKGGYLRSIELSAVYDLYRQDYCGCAFSKAERERQKINRNSTQETARTAAQEMKISAADCRGQDEIQIR